MAATSGKRLNLSEVQIRPFSSEASYNSFSCGKTPIDRFLKNKAKKTVSRHEQRVFCAHVGDTRPVIGYYALSLGSDTVSDFIKQRDDYTKNRVAFPAVHMSFIGVHEDHQRQGLGSHLLMDVFEKVAKIAQCAGLYALTLQSLDRESTAFYESLGFAKYSDDEQPKMLYPVADILALMER
ncbi:GNAT family N-acetyltransferase [Aquamicrobium defluvii]|uniref:GNAT family N-acetyltransferase n=1 Tax=Aquamicrobium defluvii TaxID=69279 RepID=UPI001414F44E|nr:GNAT family N-acetyltransferase [Aquamicrobium defluvii]